MCRAKSNVLSDEWGAFYDATEGRAPRDILLQAIKDANKPGVALDIGAGVGNETLELLARGWTVIAIDQEAEAIRRLHTKIPQRFKNKLQTQVVSFEDYDYSSSDLIHASYALPFCKPAYFPQVWRNLVTSLKDNGIFVGTLFGKNDAWKENANMTFHNRSEVEELLGSFDILHFVEKEGIRATATGGEKYWHTFEVIAKKVSSIDDE